MEQFSRLFAAIGLLAALSGTLAASHRASLTSDNRRPKGTFWKSIRAHELRSASMKSPSQGREITARLSKRFEERSEISKCL